MAKKVKTPEEVQAALEKKVAKRTIFFSTFRKALALFLGIAFTFAMVQIAFTKNSGVVTTGSSDSSQQQQQQQATDTDEPTTIELLGEDESTVKEGESVTDKQGNVTVGLSKADAVKLLNDATAKAAKAGYNWSRKCYYTDDGALQVKLKSGLDATSILNKAISTVSDSDLNKVVGNFLDITGKDEPLSAKKAKGSAAAPEGMKDKFLLKGFSLTEGDVVKFVQNGNTYKFQIKTCSNPQKDGGNALHRITDDFVTHEEVRDSVAKEISAIKVESTDVEYSNIVVVAEIKDGTLSSISINYLMDVKSLTLKVGVQVTGTGKGQVEESYNNFVY